MPRLFSDPFILIDTRTGVLLLSMCGGLENQEMMDVHYITIHSKHTTDVLINGFVTKPESGGESSLFVIIEHRQIQR